MDLALFAGGDAWGVVVVEPWSAVFLRVAVDDGLEVGRRGCRFLCCMGCGVRTGCLGRVLCERKRSGRDGAQLLCGLESSRVI